LPIDVQKLLFLLIEDLKSYGPIQKSWQNFSPLGKDWGTFFTFSLL